MRKIEDITKVAEITIEESYMLVLPIALEFVPENVVFSTWIENLPPN